MELADGGKIIYNDGKIVMLGWGLNRDDHKLAPGFSEIMKMLQICGDGCTTLVMISN